MDTNVNRLHLLMKSNWQAQTFTSFTKKELFYFVAETKPPLPLAQEGERSMEEKEQIKLAKNVRPIYDVFWKAYRVDYTIEGEKMYRVFDGFVDAMEFIEEVRNRSTTTQ